MPSGRGSAGSSGKPESGFIGEGEVPMHVRRKRWRQVLQAWGRRLACVPLACLGAAAGQEVSAQTAAVSTRTSVTRTFLNKKTIHLPILLDDRARPQLKEVQLFVKEGPQAPWKLNQSVAPTQTFFTYRAEADGEYWFSVVTVDSAGRSVPADVNKEPPGLIVMVDQTPPSADLKRVGTSEKGQEVLCEVTDVHADPLKTRFFYQTGDQVWRQLDPVAGTMNRFCIPTQAVLTGKLRVQVGDLAGNGAQKEFDLASLKGPAAGPGPGTEVVQAVSPPQGGPGVVMVEPTGHQTHLTPPPGTVQPPALPRIPDVGPVATVPGMGLSERVEIVSNKTAPTGPALPPAPLGPTAGPALPPAPLGTTGGPVLPPSTVQPASLSKRTALARKHVVNDTHVFLDYKIDQTGASGVGKVEIWLTRDEGQSWQKVREDSDLKSPAEIDLPGEGLFGVTLVVSNGRGFGAVPPKQGDQPDYWIEVDVTRPTGELLGVRPMGSNDGALIITWSARDRQLATEPIELYFATTREGPWRPIAKGLANDGNFRWIPPRDSGPHAFLRLVVRDQAGNTATCDTAQPVALDDLSRPRGRVLGVSTSPRSGLEPRGN